MNIQIKKNIIVTIIKLKFVHLKHLSFKKINKKLCYGIIKNKILFRNN